MRASLCLIGMALLLPACSRKEPPPDAAAAKPIAQRDEASRELPEELRDFRAALEASKLAYVRIRATAKQGTSATASKFRGKPYRPKGAAWPMGRDNRPLTLLAQINFADVPALDGYPRTGILQFFIGGEGDREHPHLWGMSLADITPYDPQRYFRSLHDPAYFRVVYFPEVMVDESKLDSTSPSLPDQVLPVNDEAQLIFALDSEYVSPWDYRFKAVFGKEPHELFASFGPREQEMANRYLRFSEREALAKIGGYASFVQDDPRRIQPTEDWQVLLEIRSGTEDGIDILWGDAGVGAFLIRREDLDRRDFSQVAYYWDNH